MSIPNIFELIIRDFPARLRFRPDKDSIVDWILSRALFKLNSLSHSADADILVPVTVMLSVIFIPWILSPILFHVRRHKISLLSLFIRRPENSPNSSRTPVLLTLVYY